MKGKLTRYVLIAAGGLLLVLAGFLVGTGLGPGKPPPVASGGDTDRGKPLDPPGKVIDRAEIPNPPPPPKPVANPDRVRSNLQPGKTYVTHTKGTLHVRGEDKDWGFGTVVTINYAFEAQIDREIESNDGNTIVELRHFRDVRSVKVDTKLEDVRIDLGPVGDLLIPQIQGTSLKPLIAGLRWAGISPEKLVGLGDGIKAFHSVNRLTSKKVRLTFVDGKGVLKIEPVKGEMTAAERDFHFASSLLSDSLIIPDVKIKVGNRWSVDGSNFANLIDPSLLARTGGEVTLERAPDYIVQGKTCLHIDVFSGRITLDDSNAQQGRVGHFDPRGSLDFSLEDQVIIQAKLSGKAELERFSKDHLLFQARMRHQPELEVHYTCRVVDTLKGN